MPYHPAPLSAHYPAVLRVCERMLGNPDDAADAAQETFHRALQQPAGSINDPGRWLAAVARNVCIDELRRRRDGQAALEASGQGAVAAAITGSEPERSVVGRVFVAELLDQLTAAERQVVAARLVDDRATHELAASLGVAPATTRVLLSRGLGRLRRYLAETPSHLGGGVANLPAVRAVQDRLGVWLSRLRAPVGPRSQPVTDGLAVASAAVIGLLAHGLGAGALPPAPRPPALAAAVNPRGALDGARPVAVHAVGRTVRGAAATVVHAVPVVGPARQMISSGTSGGPQPIFPGGPTPPSTEVVVPLHQVNPLLPTVILCVESCSP